MDCYICGKTDGHGKCCSFFQNFKTNLDEVLKESLSATVKQVKNKSLELDIKLNNLISDFHRTIKQIVADEVKSQLRTEVAKIANCRYDELKKYTISKNGNLPAELAFQSDIFALDINLIKGALACGIYFLYREGELQYIGKSENLLSRVAAHLAAKNFDKVYFMRVPFVDLAGTERDLIRLYKPPLNKTGFGAVVSIIENNIKTQACNDA